MNILKTLRTIGSDPGGMSQKMDKLEFLHHLDKSDNTLQSLNNFTALNPRIPVETIFTIKTVIKTIKPPGVILLSMILKNLLIQTTLTYLIYRNRMCT